MSLSLNELLDEYGANKQYQEQCFYIKNFMKENADCFERSCRAGHITASGWLVNKENTYALLMYHAKLKRWVQPGGHCDGNRDVLSVALKEAQEETGIHAIKAVSQSIFDIDFHYIPERKNEKAHMHLDMRFLLQIQTHEVPVINEEARAFYWVSRDDFDFIKYQSSLLRMAQKWKTYG